jgi:XTP/dITP diphosphohydrolase
MLKAYKFLDILSLLDFPNYAPLPENGKTLEENATIKAIHAAKTLGRLTLADDTGLVIPALQGALVSFLLAMPVKMPPILKIEKNCSPR